MFYKNFRRVENGLVDWIRTSNDSSQCIIDCEVSDVASCDQYPRLTPDGRHHYSLQGCYLKPNRCRIRDEPRTPSGYC